MELLIDRLAEALDLPPEDVRRRNFVAAADMPWTTPTGQRLDSGDYRAAYDRAAALIAAPKASEPEADGLLRGKATVAYIEPSGLGWETARLTLDPDGSIVAATGSTAQGQGRTTAVQQIVGDRLGVDPNTVAVVHGDSRAPHGHRGAGEPQHADRRQRAGRGLQYAPATGGGAAARVRRRHAGLDSHRTPDRRTGG